MLHAFLYKQYFYKQRQDETGKKIKQMLNRTLRLSFCYMKVIHILNPRYHPKIMRRFLKNRQKNKCVLIHEIILKMKIEIKNRSHR